MSKDSTLSSAELVRYDRHLSLPQVGREGQLKLKSSRVLLIGAGGLGSPLALYLAAAGVGTLGVIDHDRVEESNLQRQVLHGTAEVGAPKVDSASRRLRDINPLVEVVPYPEALNSHNALEILKDYHVVVDGTDNFATRYLVNDACVFLGLPHVYGSVFRFEGQVSVFHAAAGGPCYRCLYPKPPLPETAPNCAEGGVLGVLPGVIGTLQATEVIKLLLEIGETLLGRLLMFDALSMKFREWGVQASKSCPVCGESPTITELQDYQQFCGVAQLSDDEEISPEEMIDLWQKGARPVVIDIREPQEWEAFHLGGELGARLIPLGSLPDQLTDLDPEADYVLYCKSGARSKNAVELFKRSGFERVRSLRGGILAWPGLKG